MELVKDWVIKIAVTLVFMTAVEMLIFNNSFKKYVKFVLGLMLIVVIITPLINLVSKSDNTFVDTFSKYEKQLEETSNESKTVEANVTTKKKILENLQNNINSSLKTKFENMNFESEVQGEVDLNKFDINIKLLNIYVYDGGIAPIKKIEIGSSSKKEESNVKNSKEIKEYLSGELKIDKSKINIYSAK